MSSARAARAAEKTETKQRLDEVITQLS